MTSDLDLLRQFARENSQDAFTEIVRRHVNLVYSAALRQVRSPQLAEEISQSVFADLARNAGKLKSETVLTAWLYSVTRRTAIDAIRKESRRQLREQIAVEMNAMNATANEWTQIEPLLDDAMAALDETDRAAILLRYFENKTLREVGESLKISDDAAQKRVSRAVEKLREFFSKQKITVGASGLAVLISANAVQAAPIGLAATISATAVLAGTAVHTSTIIAATKTIAMTTLQTALQKTLVTATVAVLAGAGIYQARQAAHLRDKVQTLQQQQAPLAEQIQQLQRERDEATNQMADLRVELASANKNNLELMKLRANATRFQTVTQVVNNPAFQKANEWMAKEAKLRELFELHPEQSVPEMKYLSNEEWLDKARMADLDTAHGIRIAMSNVRISSKYKFADFYFTLALSKYLITHNQQLPESTSELSTCFPPGVGVSDAETILARYEMINHNIQTNSQYNGFAIVEKSVVDTLDSPVLIGEKKVGCVQRPGWPSDVTPHEVMPIMNAYSDSNNGEGALNVYDLVPYATTPEQKEVLNKWINSATQLH